MQLSKAIVVSCGVLLGVTAVEAGHSTLPSHRAFLTFSGPVALPGVSLAAGTYTFELADPNASPDIVMVLNRDRRDDDREAIILRVELAYPYAEIMTALGKPSVAAAQMAVSRALVRLAEEMSRGRA